MQYPRIHQKIFNEPWAITPGAYDAVRQTFLGRLHSEDLLASSPPGFLSPAAIFPVETQKTDTPAEGDPTLAIIPISGIIGKRLSSLETMCGGCDVDQIRAALDNALLDPRIETIVLHADTPGGTVTGTPELSRHIYQAALQTDKRLIGYTDTLCASAGYYILSQCHALYAAPTAHVGSIGVVMSYLDATEADAKAGLKYHTLTSGAYKDTGNPHRAMRDDEVAMLEGRLQDLAADFFAAVARVRPEVDSAGLEAKVLTGDAAQAAHLIDGQYSTLDDLLADLA